MDRLKCCFKTQSVEQHACTASLRAVTAPAFLQCVLRLVRQYPELFSSLFTYTGNIAADEVLDAVFVHDSTELHPGDEVTVKFLKQYLQECSQEGKQYIVSE